jgi:sarcosine oxidase subunit beta
VSGLRGADVVVLGAGIVGASCALRLAQRGLRVQVLERERVPAAGSTGRSAAGVRHQFSDEVNVRLSQASIAEYRSMPEAAYRPVGYLFFVPEAMWASHLDAVALQRRLGVPVQVLEPAQAAARVPAALAGVAGATFCADDGVVDPHGLCMAYVAGARAAGAAFAFGAEALAIERAAGAWQVRTAAGDFAAPMLVNATGAWAGRVAALAGLRLPVTPARRMVYATGPIDPAAGVALPCPLTVDLGSGLWLRSEGDRLIFGLANPADTGFAEGVDWTWLETVYEAALPRFPWFERLAVDRRASWWGYYEDTPDHNPVLGRRPDAEGWIDACGFSGHGVQQAAAVGRLIAQEAVGEPTAIDIDALRIGRFTGAPVPASGERLVV